MKFANARKLARKSGVRPTASRGRSGEHGAPVQNRKGRLRLGCSSRQTYLRLTRERAVFPVIGHTGVSEDEPDQVREACFGTDVVG
jgi:hypothetical protein